MSHLPHTEPTGETRGLARALNLPAECLRDAMARAVTIARCGTAATPNPQVGCVLLDHSGRIVAEGWHRGLGTAHAEVDALSKVHDAHGLTAVVTLEPCDHIGHTGPCTQVLRERGITGVLYACADPGAASGGGGQTLRAAGLTVVQADAALLGDDVLDAAQALFTEWRARESRPTVTVKWAQSIDGRIAANDRSSQWITGETARADVHRRRAQADAILVGTGTLLADDPSLTARTPRGELLVAAQQQPLPVVVGRREVPVGAKILAHPRLRVEGLTQPLRLPGTNLGQELTHLKQRGVTSVFVEGGPQVISALIRERLVDELLIYVAPLLLGGSQLALDRIGVDTITQGRRLEICERTQLGDDVLLRARFAPQTEGCACSQD